MNVLKNLIKIYYDDYQKHGPHGPDFAVWVYVDSEPFLGVRHLLCNPNLQSLLPNESEQENRATSAGEKIRPYLVSLGGGWVNEWYKELLTENAFRSAPINKLAGLPASWQTVSTGQWPARGSRVPMPQTRLGPGWASGPESLVMCVNISDF
jgi:hypothetical protein